tara:strand:+ start:1012 stop:1176 length:165 start_codon:yes stop_codon:yes gene_type:complete
VISLEWAGLALRGSMDGIRARFSSVGERGEAAALPSKILSAETSSGEERGVGIA